ADRAGVREVAARLTAQAGLDGSTRIDALLGRASATATGGTTAARGSAVATRATEAASARAFVSVEARAGRTVANLSVLAVLGCAAARADQTGVRKIAASATAE